MYKATDENVKAAIGENNFDLLEKMQLHGADFESYRDMEDKENSLLHIAAKNDNKDLIDFLKKSNIDLDLQNANGETPLHLLCGQQPNEELAKYLVMSGASTAIKNALGDTPITLAKRCGNQELAMLLSTSEQSQNQIMSTTFTPKHSSTMSKRPPTSGGLHNTISRKPPVAMPSPYNTNVSAAIQPKIRGSSRGGNHGDNGLFMDEP